MKHGSAHYALTLIRARCGDGRRHAERCCLGLYAAPPSCVRNPGQPPFISLSVSAARVNSYFEPFCAMLNRQFCSSKIAAGGRDSVLLYLSDMEEVDFITSD
eukprot:6212319-Amphidinium_carterae.1